MQSNQGCSSSSPTARQPTSICVVWGKHILVPIYSEILQQEDDLVPLHISFEWGIAPHWTVPGMAVAAAAEKVVE